MQKKSFAQINCFTVFISHHTIVTSLSYQMSAVGFAELQTNLGVFSYVKCAKSQKHVLWSEFYLIDLFKSKGLTECEIFTYGKAPDLPNLCPLIFVFL